MNRRWQHTDNLTHVIPGKISDFGILFRGMESRHRGGVGYRASSVTLGDVHGWNQNTSVLDADA